MAKSIMVQGTMSNAGKSLLVAGLCRILKQDGYRCVPFKSQNMALNSYITREGLEMGRAQVLQAQAAGVEPSVRMNPILLKPTNDTGSQVIVNGEVLGTMSAKDYFAYKKKLVPIVQQAYDGLASENDIVVIEGAGSPAEINLKQDDLVNMGMAKMAHAPVLLVGDIDRGGVFAQLVGTLVLLEQEERARIKGLVINKFRGDPEVLAPGLAMLEEKAGVPVLGVVPYLHLDLEDEDSLSERLTEKAAPVGACVDLAVIRLPRLSNFTDFNVFEAMPGVSLRYVEHVQALGQPDLILLPGTKNTMGDLKWLRESGMEAAILKCHSNGCAVFGICGGYQMLGEVLEDPDGIEEGGTLRGLGLLPMRTRFAPQKTRSRVNGRIFHMSGLLQPMEDLAVEGYEIHMGRSSCAAPYPEMNRITDAVSGRESMDGICAGNVYGTYLHGFFDAPQIAERLIGLLAEQKGITLRTEKDAGGVVSYEQYREQQLDLLADAVRRSLQMERVYQILEEGVQE